MGLPYDPDYDDDIEEEKSRRLGNKVGIAIFLLVGLLWSIYMFGGYMPIPHH